MIKKIFLSFLAALTVICSLVIPANAYQISGFSLYAKNALLINLDTGTVLYSKGADEKLYPASITKIMTALIILENAKDLDGEKISASYEAIHLLDGTGSTMLNLKPGEEITPRQLLYALLMCSAADCATAGAEYYGGSMEGFVTMMNEKAASLGMSGTHFANCHGLHDPDHYTTVNDIYKMVTEARKYDLFNEITASARYNMDATNMSRPRTIVTTNFLQDASTAYYYPYAAGIKTGYTDPAGRCLVTTATKRGVSYLCIVMNCPPRNEAGQPQRKEFVDAKNLFEWAFNNFEYKLISDTATPIGEAPVDQCRETDHVSVVLEKDFSSVLPKLADGSTVEYKLHLDKERFTAPLSAGDPLGTVDIMYANEVIGTVKVVSGESVKRSGMLAFVSGVKKVFTSKLFLALIILIFVGIFVFVMSSVIMTRRARKRRRKVKYKRY